MVFKQTVEFCTIVVITMFLYFFFFIFILYRLYVLSFIIIIVLFYLHALKKKKIGTLQEIKNTIYSHKTNLINSSSTLKYKK